MATDEGRYETYEKWSIWQIEEGGDSFWYACETASEAVSYHVQTGDQTQWIEDHEPLMIRRVASDHMLSMGYEFEEDVADMPPGWTRSNASEGGLLQIEASAAEWARFYESRDEAGLIFSTVF